MTDLVVLPKLVALVVNFLMDQDEVQDILQGDYVFTELPATKPEYMVRVTQFNDQVRSGNVLHLMATSFTIECIGGAKVTALELAQTCYAALQQRLPGTYDDCVITACDVGGLRDQPDPELVSDKGKVRPRWLFTATVWSHPLPAAS